MTCYSEDEIQQMLSDIPTEQIVKIFPGMSKTESENKYLSCFMDRDNSKVSSAFEVAELRDKRANLKAQLKTAKTIEEKKEINVQIDRLTNEIDNL